MTVKDLNVYEAKWRAPITLNTKTKNHFHVATQQWRDLLEPNYEDD
jgi:gamma-glutamyltranspeptidase